MLKGLLGRRSSSSTTPDGRNESGSSGRKSSSFRRKRTDSKSKAASRGDDRGRGLEDSSSYPASTSSGRRGYEPSAAGESVAEAERDNWGARRRDRERSSSPGPEPRRLNGDQTRSPDENANEESHRWRGPQPWSPGEVSLPPLDTGAAPTASDHFAAEISSPGFSQFPMQYDNNINYDTPNYDNPASIPPSFMPGHPDASPNSPATYDPHVPQQFPGQFPTYTAEPYRPANPAGEAADYYGDQGQSVQDQPGVRPNPPLVIPNSQAHLMPASPVNNPPPEPSSMGQVGSAADYYADSPDLDNPAPQQQFPPRPPSPSKPNKPSAVPDGISSGPVTYGDPDSSMPSEAPGSAGPMPAGSPQGSPTHGHSMGSAIGAAAAGAALGYMANHHHHSSTSSDEHPMQPSYATQNHEPYSPTDVGQPGPSIYPNPALNNPSYAAHPSHPDHQAVYHSSPFQSGSLAFQQRQRGPLDRFIDFWKDPEGVGMYEDYTEIIGVCKYCFEPGTTSKNAPRKHNYRPRRRSSDRFSNDSRVDKSSRYSASDDESRRRRSSSKKSWLGGLLSGYAVKSLFESQDFEDSYNVRPSRVSSPRVSSSDSESDSDWKGKTPRQRRRSSRSQSPNLRGRNSYSDPRRNRYEGPRLRSHSRSGSGSRCRSSSQSDRHSALRDAALGAAIGAAASAATSRPQKRRSRSPKKKGKGKKEFATDSSSSSYLDISRPATAGGLGSFFTSSSENKKKPRPRSRRSFFSFSNNNSSSSSLDADLAFGPAYAKKPKKSKKGKGKEKDEDVDAKLLGLNAAATALAGSAYAGRRPGGLLAGKDPQSRRPQSAPSAPKDDEWEDVDSEGQSSSVSSALAFGGSSQYGSSSEDSSDSGTSKWNWRWGSKKNKKKNEQKKDNSSHGDFPTGPILAGTAALGTAALASGYRKEGGHSSSSPSSSSSESLQQVDPIPASESPRFSATNFPTSSPINQPAFVRPGPIPLQQPQPVTPVSQAVYSSQGEPAPVYSAPTVPPFFPPDTFSDPFSQRRNRRDEVYPERSDVFSNANRSHRRRESSPDFYPRPFQNSTTSSSKRRPADQASVQFDLTKEQEDRERRAARREREPRDNDRDQGIQLFDHEREEKRNERRQPRRLELEPERGRSQSRSRSSSRRDRSPERRRRDDRDSSSWMGPAAAAMSSVAPSETASEDRQSRHDERSAKRHAERRLPSSEVGWDQPRKEPARSDIEDRSQTQPEPIDAEPERKPQTRAEPAPVHAEDKPQTAADDQPRPGKISTPRIPRTKPTYENYATYFAPEEIRHSPDAETEHRENASVPTTDEVGYSQAPPEARQPPLPQYDEVPSQNFQGLPWPVPQLNLIEPTPPHSQNGSVRDVTSPDPAAAEPPQKEEEVPRREQGSTTGTRVSWGGHETHEYEVPSTSSEQDSIDYEIAREPESEQRGSIGEDIEFAAALAAGAEIAGFDPAMVTDDPMYHTRSSPPHSEHREYSEPESSWQKPALYSFEPHGFGEGEVETPPREEPTAVEEASEVKRHRSRAREALERFRRRDAAFDAPKAKETMPGSFEPEPVKPVEDLSTRPIVEERRPRDNDKPPKRRSSRDDASVDPRKTALELSRPEPISEEPQSKEEQQPVKNDVPSEDVRQASVPEQFAPIALAALPPGPTTEELWNKEPAGPVKDDAHLEDGRQTEAPRESEAPRELETPRETEHPVCPPSPSSMYRLSQEDLSRSEFVWGEARKPPAPKQNAPESPKSMPIPQERRSQRDLNPVGRDAALNESRETRAPKEPEAPRETEPPVCPPSPSSMYRMSQDELSRSEFVLEDYRKPVGPKETGPVSRLPIRPGRRSLDKLNDIASADKLPRHPTPQDTVQPHQERGSGSDNSKSLDRSLPTSQQQHETASRQGPKETLPAFTSPEPASEEHREKDERNAKNDSAPEEGRKARGSKDNAPAPRPLILNERRSEAGPAPAVKDNGALEDNPQARVSEDTAPEDFVLAPNGEDRRRNDEPDSANGNALENDQSARHDEDINVQRYRFSRQQREERRRREEEKRQQAAEEVGVAAGETREGEYEKDRKDAEEHKPARSPETPVKVDDGKDTTEESSRPFSLNILDSRLRSRSISPPSSAKAIVDVGPKSRSRPTSPELNQHRESLQAGDGERSRRLSMLRDSPTAIPLQFRRPPSTSPQGQLSSSVGSPEPPVLSLASPPEKRARRTSSEFVNSREIRPLFLVEQHGSGRAEGQQPVDEQLPSLPSSKSSSPVEELSAVPDEKGWEVVNPVQDQSEDQPTRDLPEAVPSQEPASEDKREDEKEEGDKDISRGPDTQELVEVPLPPLPSSTGSSLNASVEDLSTVPDKESSRAVEPTQDAQSEEQPKPVPSQEPALNKNSQREEQPQLDLPVAIPSHEPACDDEMEKGKNEKVMEKGIPETNQEAPTKEPIGDDFTRSDMGESKGWEMVDPIQGGKAENQSKSDSSTTIPSQEPVLSRDAQPEDRPETDTSIAIPPQEPSDDDQLEKEKGKGKEKGIPDSQQELSTREIIDENPTPPEMREKHNDWEMVDTHQNAQPEPQRKPSLSITIPSQQPAGDDEQEEEEAKRMELKRHIPDLHDGPHTFDTIEEELTASEILRERERHKYEFDFHSPAELLWDPHKYFIMRQPPRMGSRSLGVGPASRPNEQPSVQQDDIDISDQEDEVVSPPESRPSTPPGKEIPAPEPADVTSPAQGEEFEAPMDPGVNNVADAAVAATVDTGESEQPKKNAPETEQVGVMEDNVVVPEPEAPPVKDEVVPTIPEITVPVAPKEEEQTRSTPEFGSVVDVAVADTVQENQNLKDSALEALHTDISENKPAAPESEATPEAKDESVPTIPDVSVLVTEEQTQSSPGFGGIVDAAVAAAVNTTDNRQPGEDNPNIHHIHGSKETSVPEIEITAPVKETVPTDPDVPAPVAAVKEEEQAHAQAQANPPANLPAIVDAAVAAATGSTDDKVPVIEPGLERELPVESKGNLSLEAEPAEQSTSTTESAFSDESQSSENEQQPYRTLSPIMEEPDLESEKRSVDLAHDEQTPLPQDNGKTELGAEQEQVPEQERGVESSSALAQAPTVEDTAPEHERTPLVEQASVPEVESTTAGSKAEDVPEVTIEKVEDPNQASKRLSQPDELSSITAEPAAPQEDFSGSTQAPAPETEHLPDAITENAQDSGEASEELPQPNEDLQSVTTETAASRGDYPESTQDSGTEFHDAVESISTETRPETEREGSIASSLERTTDTSEATAPLERRSETGEAGPVSPTPQEALMSFWARRLEPEVPVQDVQVSTAEDISGYTPVDSKPEEVQEVGTPKAEDQSLEQTESARAPIEEQKTTVKSEILRDEPPQQIQDSPAPVEPSILIETAETPAAETEPAVTGDEKLLGKVSEKHQRSMESKPRGLEQPAFQVTPELVVGIASAETPTNATIETPKGELKKQNEKDRKFVPFLEPLAEVDSEHSQSDDAAGAGTHETSGEIPATTDARHSSSGPAGVRDVEPAPATSERESIPPVEKPDANNAAPAEHTPAPAPLSVGNQDVGDGGDESKQHGLPSATFDEAASIELPPSPNADADVNVLAGISEISLPSTTPTEGPSRERPVEEEMPHNIADKQNPVDIDIPLTPAQKKKAKKERRKKRQSASSVDESVPETPQDESISVGETGPVHEPPATHVVAKDDGFEATEPTAEQPKDDVPSGSAETPETSLEQEPPKNDVPVVPESTSAEEPIAAAEPIREKVQDNTMPSVETSAPTGESTPKPTQEQEHDVTTGVESIAPTSSGHAEAPKEDPVAGTDVNAPVENPTGTEQDTAREVPEDHAVEAVPVQDQPESDATVTTNVQEQPDLEKDNIHQHAMEEAPDIEPPSPSKSKKNKKKKHRRSTSIEEQPAATDVTDAPATDLPSETPAASEEVPTVSEEIAKQTKVPVEEPAVGEEQPVEAPATEAQEEPHTPLSKRQAKKERKKRRSMIFDKEQISSQPDERTVESAQHDAGDEAASQQVEQKPDDSTSLQLSQIAPDSASTDGFEIINAPVDTPAESISPKPEEGPREVTSEEAPQSDDAPTQLPATSEPVSEQPQAESEKALDVGAPQPETSEATESKEPEPRKPELAPSESKEAELVESVSETAESKQPEESTLQPDEPANQETGHLSAKEKRKAKKDRRRRSKILETLAEAEAEKARARARAQEASTEDKPAGETGTPAEDHDLWTDHLVSSQVEQRQVIPSASPSRLGSEQAEDNQAASAVNGKLSAEPVQPSPEEPKPAAESIEVNVDTQSQAGPDNEVRPQKTPTQEIEAPSAAVDEPAPTPSGEELKSVRDTAPVTAQQESKDENAHASSQDEEPRQATENFPSTQPEANERSLEIVGPIPVDEPAAADDVGEVLKRSSVAVPPNQTHEQSSDKPEASAKVQEAVPADNIAMTEANEEAAPSTPSRKRSRKEKKRARKRAKSSDSPTALIEEPLAVSEEVESTEPAVSMELPEADEQKVVAEEQKEPKVKVEGLPEYAKEPGATSERTTQETVEQPPQREIETIMEPVEEQPTAQPLQEEEPATQYKGKTVQEDGKPGKLAEKQETKQEPGNNDNFERSVDVASETRASLSEGTQSNDTPATDEKPKEESSTTPRLLNRMASIFPDIKRGSFRLPSRNQSVKDRAEDETTDPEVSRGFENENATRVSEAPITLSNQVQEGERQRDVHSAEPFEDESSFQLSTTTEPETTITDVAIDVEVDEFYKVSILQDGATGGSPAIAIDTNVGDSAESTDQSPDNERSVHSPPSSDGQSSTVVDSSPTRADTIRGVSPLRDLQRSPSPLAPKTPSTSRSLAGSPLPARSPEPRERVEKTDGARTTDLNRGKPRLEIKPVDSMQPRTPRSTSPVREFTNNAWAPQPQQWPTASKQQGWNDVIKPPVRQNSLPIARMPRTPEQRKPILRPSSMGNFHGVSSIQQTPRSPEVPRSLRRSSKTTRDISGDLRAASRVLEDENDSQPPPTDINIERIASSSSYDPVTDKGKKPLRGMTDVYEAWGETPSSPRSPSRPPSVRHRRSMQHLQELETRLDQLISENRLLIAARDAAEDKLKKTTIARRKSDQALNSQNTDLRDREEEVEELKKSVEWFQKEVNRLTKENEGLNSTNNNLAAVHAQELREIRESSAREIEELRTQYQQATADTQERIRREVDMALAQKNADLRRLREELESARDKVKRLQQQLAASARDDVVVFRDEDFFEAACHKLSGYVQQWVLRFSKHSDHRRCRRLSDLQDDKLVDRLDNAILDGSDVESYLADRVRRRDVFTSVVMTMVWEFVFARYMFGMDREQRQKLKILEKQLTEAGTRTAVHRWRATTLSLLSKRPSFAKQREADTDGVALEIFNVVSSILPPPTQVENQLLESLRKVLRVAVTLSVEMRSQLAEYIMLPPLQPEYDANGVLARYVHFNASLMNERSDLNWSNEDLEAHQAPVRMVLFPLVVKKGNDRGEGEDEVVVYPAQVLVTRPNKDKHISRVVSGDRMSLDTDRQPSIHSTAPSSSHMDSTFF